MVTTAVAQPAQVQTPAVLTKTYQKTYQLGTKINLPHDFTILYLSPGTVNLDNLPFEDVASLAIQDKHPMWIELKTPAKATYGLIQTESEVQSEKQLQIGTIHLTPLGDAVGLEAVVTGYRRIPEIDALNTKFQVKVALQFPPPPLYSPELVSVTTSAGASERFWDIDFVNLRAPKGIEIILQTPLDVPKELYR